MTSHTSRTSSWKRAVTVVVAAGALAAGPLVGLAPTAFAAPADSASGATGADPDAPPPQTAEEVLAIIQSDYDTGAGGGQLSNLIHSVMKLRAQGFMPSNANRDAIVEALDHRPNQQPLIEALQATLNTQQRAQARSQAASVPPTSMTVGQQRQPGDVYDPNGNRNQDAGGITITQPVG